MRRLRRNKPAPSPATTPTASLLSPATSAANQPSPTWPGKSSSVSRRSIALVNAAGLNIPDRGLNVLQPKRFREVIDTNLTGSLLCTLAFLPAMRAAGNGTIVNIVSDAGILASAKAGAAYAASKFGQRGLTQSINAEERGNGIRACAICPGDINTPILDKRPVPPPPEARAEDASTGRRRRLRHARHQPAPTRHRRRNPRQAAIKSAF